MDPNPGSTAPEELLAQVGFLRRLAYELVHPDEAADLVQETVLVALAHPPRRPGPLRGWLATVAANLARNSRRGASRRGEREKRAARPERLDPGEVPLVLLERQRELLELVLALPDEQRTVLSLRYYEGLTPTAISARLALPVKTVKSRHTRALAELRERLDVRSQGDRQRWLAALLPLATERAPRASGGPGAALLGGLTVGRTLAAGVLLAFVGWWAWPSSPRAAAPLVGAGTATPDVVASKGEASELAPAAPSAAAREPLSTPNPLATGGALRLTFRWSDGSPASDLGFGVLCKRDPAPRDEVRRARTDEAGEARLAGLPPGPARIFVDLEASFRVEVEAGETRALEFTLPVGTAVQGRVVDGEGRAVGGAEVWIETTYLEWPSPQRVAVAAADGTFRLRDVGENARLGARATGYVPSATFELFELPATPTGAREANLVLAARGGRVRGRVLDPGGQPLAGASVLVGAPMGLALVGSSARPHGRAPKPAVCESAADGSFLFPTDFSVGTQPLHAMAHGFPLWEGAVDVALGGESVVEIRLERSARIEGRVLDPEGRPAADLHVLAAVERMGGWYQHAFPPSDGDTDAEGRFVLDWVAPGTIEVNAWDRKRPERGRVHTEIACTAGETATCELVLDLGRTIRGRLEDENGVALAGWSVTSQSSWQSIAPASGSSVVTLGSWYPRDARSDERGRFLLANLDEGAHDLVVRDPELDSHPLVEVKSVLPGPEERVIVVTGARARKGFVRGRLVVNSGAAFRTDPVITLWKEGGNAGYYVEVDPAHGTFEVPAFAGRYYVRVSCEERELLAGDTFEVREGAATDLGDLVIEAAGRVEIAVDGLPAEALGRLRFTLEAEGKSSVTLELADGLLCAPVVSPGTWRIELNENELYLRGDEIEVLPGGTVRAEVEIERAITVRLRFTNPEMDSIQLEARDRDGKLLRARGLFPSYTAGVAFASIGLPAGPATIELRTHGGRSGRVEVEASTSLFGADPIVVELH